MEEKLGRVFVAPNVLVTIARLTTLSVPGVARMSPRWARGVGRLLGGGAAGDGVRVQLEDDAVIVDLHIVARHDANMLNLGRTIQAEVARAIQDMVGMEVKEVNVYIQDVEFGSEEE